jgi:excisionase family DNA binding protein
MAADAHTEHERLMSIPEVATRLNLSIGHVRRLIRQGEIPALRLSSRPGSSLRIDSEELEAWLRSQPEDVA